MRNLLGRRFAIDTNLIGRETPATARLWEYHHGDWIQLLKTDTLDTELSGAADPATRDRLLEESAPLVEQLGPMVWDHSRWDHTVWGSDTDAAQLDEVINVLFPGDDPRRDGAPRGRQRLRDAMHLNTAKRYALDGLITLDAKDLLSKADQVSAAFNGFQIFTPERALASVDCLRERYEIHQGGRRVT